MHIGGMRVCLRYTHKQRLKLMGALKLFKHILGCLEIITYTDTHTHTHIYIYNKFTYVIFEYIILQFIEWEDTTV
jgi:hypothetical protein